MPTKFGNWRQKILGLNMTIYGVLEHYKYLAYRMH